MSNRTTDRIMCEQIREAHVATILIKCKERIQQQTYTDEINQTHLKMKKKSSENRRTRRLRHFGFCKRS